MSAPLLVHRTLSDSGETNLSFQVEGEFETVNSPFNLHGTTVGPQGPAPEPGEHTDWVLADRLGLGPTKIAKLRVRQRRHLFFSFPSSFFPLFWDRLSALHNPTREKSRIIAMRILVRHVHLSVVRMGW